jgi:hypothetical protein
MHVGYLMLLRKAIENLPLFVGVVFLLTVRGVSGTAVKLLIVA